MNGLQFSDSVMARIRRQGGQYDERAYLFVLAAVEWACHAFAVEQFGLMAQTVLAHWGVTRTDDFGRIVYTLVDVGLLVTQPGDRESDFAGVYEFADVFGGHYDWQGVPKTATG